jgi:hypothetical protein
MLAFDGVTFFLVLVFEFRACTLSAPFFFCDGFLFFEIESGKLFAQAGFEPQSSLS